MPEKLKKLYEGKAKIVYETEDPEKLILYFKDTATAFDGIKKAELKGKGALNNTISSIIFEILHRNGIRTHYIEKLSENEMLVWRAERFLVEVVVRNIAAGSVVKRLGFNVFLRSACIAAVEPLVSLPNCPISASAGSILVSSSCDICHPLS